MKFSTLKIFCTLKNFKTSLLIPSLAMSSLALATDHNEPNAVNGIFENLTSDAGDLYGLFGFPAKTAEDTVTSIMTFAPADGTGIFNPNVIYRIHMDADKRIDKSDLEDIQRTALIPGLGAKVILDKILALTKLHGVRAKHPQIYVTYREVNSRWVADYYLVNFKLPNGVGNTYVPSGAPTGDTMSIYVLRDVPTASVFEDKKIGIKLYSGGNDDAFFTDLGGFFRSINYSPYFKNENFGASDYRKKDADRNYEDLRKQKSFCAIDDSRKHCYEEKDRYGEGVKRYGVYTGRDDRAGYNVNAIAVEIPLKLITDDSPQNRIVHLWGDSHRKTLDADRNEKTTNLINRIEKAVLVKDGKVPGYELIDTLGLPFVDTVLGERKLEFNSGAANSGLQLGYVNKLIQLGYGFGPTLERLGFETCFGLKNSFDKNPQNKSAALLDFTLDTPRALKCLLMSLRMPNDEWKNVSKDSSKLHPPIVATLFHPNTLKVDMDTNGTFPFGRRPEDQVASRFTSLFLNHKDGYCATAEGKKPCHVDSLQEGKHGYVTVNGKDRSFGFPINPKFNDKPFKKEFPYLAEPWTGADEVRQR